MVQLVSTVWHSLSQLILLELAGGPSSTLPLISSDCRCTKRRFPRSRYGLVSGLKSASIFEVIGKVSALLPDEVEIVTTDEFVSLARAAAPIRK